MTTTNSYLVADLFCGAGGSSTGAKKAIAEIGGTMELDEAESNPWKDLVDSARQRGDD